MTSQKDQIQALITDIDSVLQKTTPRLPWVVSGEMTQQRQILERVRNYLVTFQRRQMAGEGFEQAGARPDLLAHDIYYQPAQASYPPPQTGGDAERSRPYGQNEAAAQQMLQALVQEMGYLRSNVVQPLQSDVETLRQQREALVQEIRHLEAQRQGYAGSLPGNQQQVIAEFLQALMNRLQETLPQQVAQSLRGGNQQSLPYGTNLALSGSAPMVATTSDAPYPGSGNIQVPQSQADELLIKLDSTLSVVFESLQRNVQAYEESLSQGLSKMHSLGQQGEMMFTALISHLASQLGQEASSYLQPPTASRLESARSVPPTTGAAPNSAQTAQSASALPSPSSLGQPNAPASPSPVDAARPLTLPFPGTELSNKAPADASATANASKPVDTAIESWLRSAGSAEGESSVDLEIAELNLEGFDLNQLAAQDVNALLELDANLLGTNLPPQPMLAAEPQLASAQPPSGEPAANTISAEDTADIDAALKLLEQLSSELEEQPTSVADADAQIDRMLTSPPTVPGETAAESIPDDAKDELDEFYESLFGNQTIAAEPSTTEPSATEPSIAESPTAAAAPTQMTAIPTVEVPTSEAATPVDQGTPSVSPAEPASSTEPAIAPVGTQLQTQSLTVPSTTSQPIDTLPAETESPAEVLGAAAVVPPSVSTSADPTLGWDLSAPSLAGQTTEPEIPAALLEDELLDGWDLDDAEVDLDTLAMPLTGDDPLGLGETATTSDRFTDDFASIAPSDAAVSPSESQSLSELQGLSESQSLSELQGLGAEPTAQVPPELPPANRAPQPQDEIATLTDLFDETPSEVPLSAPPIDSPVETPSQSLIVPPASSTPGVLPVVASETPPPAQRVDDRVTDDRYTPAAPEEDLLPLHEVAEEPDPELWLDESTLNRLSEDLFNLEDVIGEPSVLPPSDTPSADEAVLFPDATAGYESEPTSESASLADWTAALDDGSSLSPALDSPSPTAELEQNTPAAQPDAFILEGMDDLFANTPTEPPVVPIAPPVSPTTEPAAAFTLEGMSNLFADPLTDTAPSPPVSSTTSQSLSFTLEGMDELFGDVPVVPLAASPSTSDAPDQPLPFTLEGVDSLFADVPSIADVPPTSDTVVTTPSPEQSEPVSTFSFEQVGNLFVEVPSAGGSADSGTQEVIAPPVAPPPEPTHEPVAPFTLEQVGDLFMEMPSGASPVLDVGSVEQAPPLSEPVLDAATTPFSLEQVGDLFADMPSDEPPLDLTSSPILQPPPLDAESSTTAPTAPDLSAAEPSTLEQAFASLMGVFEEPTAPTNEGGLDSQDSEKKNGMS